jgi:hypothetical protein
VPLSALGAGGFGRGCSVLGAGGGATAGAAVVVVVVPVTAPQPQPVVSPQVEPQVVQPQVLQQHLLTSRCFNRSANGWQQPQPQAGFSQQVGAGAAQQVGFSQQPQVGLQQENNGWQHSGLWQPQAGAAQHVGAGAAQHVGAGAAQHVGAGAAQHVGLAQQVGSGAQHLAAQALHVQQLWQAKTSFRPQNRSRTGVMGWQQPQVGLAQHSQAGLAQQAGSGAQHFAGAQVAQPLQQPPQPAPAKRSSNSNADAWLQRATLNRSAPTTGMLFIEQQLLYNELRSRCPGRASNNQSVTQVALAYLGGSSHG